MANCTLRNKKWENCFTENLSLENQSLDNQSLDNAPLKIDNFQASFLSLNKHFVVNLEKALTSELKRNLAFGCVNMTSSGSHKDMDLALFQKSGQFICSKLAELNYSSALSFTSLRQAGYTIEKELMQVTNGINTQKGLLFLSLFLWQAWVKEVPWSKLSKQIKDFSKDLQADYVNMALSRSSQSRGLGLNDIRQLPLTGFQSLLLVVEAYIKEKWSDLRLTLQLIAKTDDTTTAHRGNIKMLRYVQKEAQTILTLDGDAFNKKAKDLNAYYLEHNLSSGGVADLFSLTKCLASLHKDWPK